MEKEKQIIVAAVGVVAVFLLYYFLVGFSSGSSNNSGETAYSLNFETPEVDEKEIKLIESATKKEIYDDDLSEYDHSKYDSLANNFAFLSKMRGKIGSIPTNTSKKTKTKVSKADEFKRQLEELEKLGKKSVGLDEVSTGGALTSASTPIASKPVPVKVAPQPGNYFFGASSAPKSKSWQDLVPAETVDQGMYRQGSTIAIRTKKSLSFPNTRITIPKDALVYGKVSFQSERILIDIKTYKYRNRLYPVDVTTHDFDGREGIHLKTNSLFEIPANVSETVLDAAMSTYSQQITNVASTGGGSSVVPIKDLAVIAGINEVSQEIFAKRRVFIPRKYHVWLTVTQKDEQR